MIKSTETVAAAPRLAGFSGVVCAFLVVAGALFTSSMSRAQDLPCDIVTSAAPLSNEQKQAVQAYAEQFLAPLAGDDAVKVRDGRNGLVKPLQRCTPGVPFRQAYTKILDSELKKLVEGNRTINAVNALRVASEVATTEGFDIIEKGFASKDVAVRVAAAGAASHALEIAAKTPSIAVPKRLYDMNVALGKLAETDPDADVVDGATEALVQSLKTATSPETRNAAVAALCKVARSQSQKIKTSVPESRTLFAILRTGLALRDELTIANAGNRSALPAEAVKSIAETAGDMIAMVARLLSAGALPVIKSGDVTAVKRQKEDDRRVPTQIVGAAEQILSLIADRTEPIRANLAEKVRAGSVQSDAQFVLDAKQLLGPDGRLTRPPFSLPGNRFAL
ncbi:MAG: hypothetical protein U0573_13680 [Phycisphaerales bacterium]|nr:hypothetical protein [Planctomycetota bacterium]